MINSNQIAQNIIHAKIKFSEYGSDPCFPRARASEYSMERGQAYLLSSERVQELPCRSGRHIRFEGSDSNRIRVPLQLERLQFLRLDHKALRKPDIARV